MGNLLAAFFALLLGQFSVAVEKRRQTETQPTVHIQHMMIESVCEWERHTLVSERALAKGFMGLGTCQLTCLSIGCTGI